MIDRRTIFPSIVDSRSCHLSSSKSEIGHGSEPSVSANRFYRSRTGSRLRRLKDLGRVYIYIYILTFQRVRPWHPRAPWLRRVRFAWCGKWFHVPREFRPSFSSQAPFATCWQPVAESSGWKYPANFPFTQLLRNFTFRRASMIFYLTRVHVCTSRASEIVFFLFFFSFSPFLFPIGSSVTGNERSNVLTS